MNEDINLNIEKFKDVIHYLISKCGHKENFTRDVMYKILYFIDFDYYELYEVSLTGEKYIHKFEGPFPMDFNEAISQLIKENRIKENKMITHSNFIYP